MFCKTSAEAEKIFFPGSLDTGILHFVPGVLEVRKVLQFNLAMNNQGRSVIEERIRESR